MLDFLNQDYTYNPISESPLITPAQGIGLAPEAAPAVAQAPVTGALPMNRYDREQDLKKAAVAKMGGVEKVFSALGEFGAGVTGHGATSPLTIDIRQQREERLAQAEEFKLHTQALEDGVKIAKGLQGDAKNGFVEDYAAQLEQAKPGLGKTFKHLSANPNLLTNLQSYQKYLPKSVMLLAQNDPQAFWHLAGSAEGIKLFQKAEAQYETEFATNQATGMISNLQQLGLPEELVAEANKAGAGGKLPASVFNKIQDYLPAGHPYKISPEGRAAINANKEESDLFHHGLNMLSPSDEAGIAKKHAEEKPKLQPGDMQDIPLGGKNFAKGAYDPDKTLFPKAEHDANGFAILGKGTKEGIQINMPSSEGFGVNPETGEKGHYTLGKDGTLRWDKVAPLPKAKKGLAALEEDMGLQPGELFGTKEKNLPEGTKINIVPKGTQIPKKGTAIPKADQLGVQHKFANDPSMEGNKLGAQTSRGWEVKDKSGKLIGYYR